MEVIFKIFVLFSVYSDWMRVIISAFQNKGNEEVNLTFFSRQKLVVRKFIKSNANVLMEKSKELSSGCCHLEQMSSVQVFALSVNQKGLDYFVITLRIHQLQAYKNS